MPKFVMERQSPRVGKLTILGLWSLLFAGSLVAAPVPATPAVAIDHLFQHWVLSYEEAEPGQTVQIFRPEGSDDAHDFEACAWSIGEPVE